MGKLGVFFILFTLLAVLSSFPAAAPAFAQEGSDAHMYVSLTTSRGVIVLELDPAAAPQTVDNFVQYVRDGHYAGVIFHRVIPGFMIQGGGLDENLKERATRPSIKNEANNGLLNDHYTVAMARTSDPHSATAQFFINTNDNDFLNFSAETPQGWGYAVFGRVVKGREVVDQIEKTPTGSQGFHDDVPKTPVKLEKAEVLDNYDPSRE